MDDLRNVCTSCEVFYADVIKDGKPLCDDCAKPVEMSLITFKCKCGLIATVKYPSWTCGDSLYYTCPQCNEYYKKAIRIPKESRITFS